MTTNSEQNDNIIFQELLKHWGLSEPIVIGQYKAIQNKPFGFFNDVQDLAGNKLNYPNESKNVSAFIYTNDLKDKSYYQFSICLASKKKRDEKNNQFLVQADSEEEIKEVEPPIKTESILTTPPKKPLRSTRPLIIEPQIINQQTSEYTPKEWIQKLFNDHGKTADDAEMLSKMSDLLSEDLYTETERFIFELLQNADDFPNESGKVEIHFVILNKHLLILHNGKSFSQEEVKAISKMGDSTKDKNSTTTGYKGIGFKSVFTDSNCVYIFSNNYCFRYDENYHEHPELIPWKMKPIWTEKSDLPLEIQGYSDFFQYPVAIALKVAEKKISEYKIKIKELFDEPRFMLFLRHVNSIKVSGLNQGLTISLSLNKNNYKNTIFFNGKQKNEWLVKDVEFNVSDDVKQNIKDDKEVPEKLKKATITKLTFGSKIQETRIVKLSSEESVLFTYLPTNVKDFEFPFVVNADFLTTANRQDLHRDNDWNAFIFEQIGYYLFEFLQWIVINQPNYRNYITSLIKYKFVHPTKLEQAFNRGLEKGLEEIAFIPSEESNRLLKVSEAIFDETGITTIVETEIIKSILNIKKEFISNSLENPIKLEKIGVQVFDIDDLIKCLQSQDLLLSNYYEIIKFLHKKGYEKEIKEAEVPIFLDEHENFIASTADDPVYFQPSLEDRNLLTFDSFSFLHPVYTDIFQKDSEIQECFKALGVKEFKPVQMIKERIRKGKYKPEQNTFNDHVNHIRFIYKYRNQLTPNEYQKLSQLHILYKQEDKYYPSAVSSSYLSDYYKPNNPLESVADELGLNNLKFIVSNYCENENEIDDWREFFLKIGIIKPNAINFISDRVIPLIENNEINQKNSITITRFIFSVLGSPLITDNNLKSKLKNLPLLTTNGLKKAEECYLSDFYSFNAENTSFLQDIKVENIVSEEYYQPYQSTDEWRQFFLNIGVKELNKTELIKQKNKIINENSDLVNSQNTIQLVREIFKHRNELTQDDFDNLRKLNLLLKNDKIAPAQECYLSNEYQPRQNLEDLFSTTDFDKIVSSKYIINQENSKEWKDFFLKIGVYEEINIKFILRQNLIFPFAYIQFINKSGIIQQNQIYSAENILSIDCFSEYCSNYTFSIKIWSYFSDNWNRLNLDVNSTIWINNQQYNVFSFFKFTATQYNTIPCNDFKCRKPAEVYSYFLKSHLQDCNLPICSINFPTHIEEFLSIKRNLDIKACLQLLEKISNNKSSEKIIKEVSFVYEQLIKNIEKGLNDHDKNLIREWIASGKLLACDENFYPVSDLYYLANDVNLPYKRNPNLVYIPDNLEQFEDVLSTFEINKITWNEIKVYYDAEKNQCQILPQLIKQRAYYLSVYLANSTNNQLVDSQHNNIIEALETLNIQNPEKLYYCFEKIGYEENMYNFYAKSSNTIFYVGIWKTRKNAKIGEYLIDALEIDQKKITPEKLLDFLEDPLNEIVEELRKNGFDLPQIKETEEENVFENSYDNLISSHINYDDGTGENPEQWGEWGENIARNLYEKQGYTVTKKSDGTGYDFLCQKDNHEVYSEVKTISSQSETIRITTNEWRVMCQPQNQEKYELLIIVHSGKSVEQIIRIKSAWITLQEIISQLNEYKLTSEIYKGNVEMLMGFQRNSRNSANDIIFNYSRISEEGCKLTNNIRRRVVN
ncbi:sacsin N-terminal ATP-binding-like domain-containing protein (plasmid) [Cyanobacterium sp. IPPAS B-1200]|uniref:DUF3883 domain-containing protein n=1 Tax=Cyanobacterium sp. IPPAS B-1200 TaxID=1562720 RepID=UPI0008527C27|nr:DUF3883 domain-containing protein [Cyanobacterium sp. IPPAS B-1200]OEJ80010.1 hypothetical protein A5482_07695 [Cyanobacterium sp. IPPAS B-1200]